MGFGLQVRGNGRKAFTLDYRFQGLCERYSSAIIQSWWLRPRRMSRGG
jgi:hypothetical protein